ncbi:SDR family NAD(P)-dependent oxidoreductase [Belliella kenyensis]|uniref:SDR family NAD(P)-dependent oxidoreductase n=1 Tax=Belliella kenyensis TaxID=1472724 RepID=A0ABV8EPL3_9BACT|nr:SDR family NAD(P)-dependent oxidoreductase [Belliella kenyensis]MCH7400678.1 SDR family NAD(P)-dependent oxidoreductase [Belliella kenyensis]MDN3602035.1 SDR family NAD(P)-dependent oxidoreductase [Belliella kenyensis]
MKSLFIITGTSKGIGEALLQLLSNNNENTIISISRSQSNISLSNVTHFEIDLGSFDQLVQHLDKIFLKDDFEKVVLINNAGWIGEINHFGKLSHKSISDIYKINTVAPAILMNEYFRHYADLKSIKIIINISSGAAEKVIDGWSGYSSTKASLNMLSKIAQAEADQAGNGIKVFAVSPGVVDTEMQKNIRSAPNSGFSNLEKFKNLKKQNNLSSPKEAAEKILQVISDYQKFESVLLDVRKI